MTRMDAARFRKEQMKTRSTFIPMPPNPSVDVDAIERPTNHGFPSIFWGAIAGLGLLTFGAVLFLVVVVVL